MCMCLCVIEGETKRGSWCHSECVEGFFDFQEGSMTVWQGLRGHGRKSFDADCRQKASTTYKWLFILSSFFTLPLSLLAKCLGTARVGRCGKCFYWPPLAQCLAFTNVFAQVCPPTPSMNAEILCFFSWTNKETKRSKYQERKYSYSY